MNIVDCESEQPGGFRQVVHVRGHTFSADIGPPDSVDSAPGAHDYFDASLAACKTLTAAWFARRNGIPLERVEAHVERDDSQERAGVYRLRLRITYYGPLSDEQRASLARAVARCPVSKLMTTSEVQIEMVE